METILLTGATGFLGSHLLEGLLKENYNVVIIKRTFSNTWRISHQLHKVKSHDIDVVPLESVFKENQIDVVMHAATQYGKTGNDTAAIIESNILLPVKLIELSVVHGASCFINTDSFFNSSTLKYKYLGEYSLSKKHLLEWLTLFSDKIQVINLKLEHLYGPKDSDTKFITWFIKECIKNGPELKLTKGEQKRDFIYISDAVNAFLLTLKKRKMISAFYEFELGTGDDISIRDFTVMAKKAVSRVSGTESGIYLNFGATPYREGEFMESKADNSALTQLGWTCKVSLEEGLEKTIKDILCT